jgi:hypothetical protein
VDEEEIVDDANAVTNVVVVETVGIGMDKEKVVVIRRKLVRRKLMLIKIRLPRRHM